MSDNDKMKRYTRPSTRGGLKVLIKEGIECEVVTDNVGMTEVMLDGWLNFSGQYKVRPSENAGWSVFYASTTHD